MKKVLLSLVVALGLVVLLTSELAYSGGSPGAKTGSPGDGNANCTQCHSGSANSVTGWVTSTIPAWGYVPGETYTVTVSGTHTGVSKFGFEVTAENSQNDKTGTLSITNSTETKLTNSNHAVTQKSGGTTPSGASKSWSFDWKAPDAGVGSVTFYAAFNAADGDGSTSGDAIYLSSLIADENTSTGIDDNKFENAVSVYPVPFNSQISISVKDGMNAEQINLYNSIGVLVKSIKVNSKSGEKINVNAENLEAGVYILNIIGTNGEQVSKQIIKTK